MDYEKTSHTQNGHDPKRENLTDAAAVPAALFGADGFSDANEAFSTLSAQKDFCPALAEQLAALLEGGEPASLQTPRFALWDPYLIVAEPGGAGCKVSLPRLAGILERLHDPGTEQFFFKILEAMYDDCVIINKDGVLETAMPNFEAMYGLHPSQAVGRTVYELEDQGIFNPSIGARVLQSGRQEVTIQLTHSGKYLMTTAIPIRDADGSLQKVISYSRDVTKYESLLKEHENLKEMLSAYSSEIEQLRQEQNTPPHVIHDSAEMRKVVAQISRIAKFDSHVLITGESGVGKTMYAKLLHAQSPRKDGPFIEINCGTIPENLFESELFGYERGAFTGANREGKPGFFELADGGTLFLDEIGDLPFHMQAKLLKVIQDQRIIRVGGIHDRPVDFRLISATNRKLDAMVEAGAFREDLYYRLNVIAIDVPPLREHKDDILHLTMHFVDKICEKYNIKRSISNKVIDALVDYDWPGNIRQLENVVERMLLSADGYVIKWEHLPPAISKKAIQGYNPEKQGTLKEMMESVEKRIFTDYYKKYGSTTKVAKALGISQPSASMKLSKYLPRNK